MSGFDRLLIFVFIFAAIAAGGYWSRPSEFQPGQGRRPVPQTSPSPPAVPNNPDRVRRPPVAPLSPSDPTFVVEGSERPINKTGTAFSLDARGTWFTARHVIAGCARLFLDSTWGRIPATVLDAHPSADLAILSSGRGGPALALNDMAPEYGEDGTALGFPGGKLGGEWGQLLGRARMLSRGGINGVTPTLAWAELRRVPEELESLGGLSGGPMFDDTGAVVGVMVAESQRRGRVYTTAPELLHAAIVDLPAATRTRFRPVVNEPDALALNAQRAAQDQRIARVVCFAT